MKDVMREKNNGIQKNLVFDGHGLSYECGRSINVGMRGKHKNFHGDHANYGRNVGRR